MWMLLGAIALVAVLALVLKVMERRSSRDPGGAEDVARIVRDRIGRSSSTGGPGDGGGFGS
jgi:hypothetical protein